MAKVNRSSAALLATLLLLIAACGNSKSSGAGGSAASGSSGGNQRAGISDTEIKVGGVASITNGLSGTYGDAFDGAQAYFDTVNAAGGVNGRKITMVSKRDDNGQASRNATQVRALVEQENVFAVLPVSTLSFAGADYLAKASVPTFGWNINPEWSGPPNLFGEKGSHLCFDCPNAWSSYVAKQLGFTNIGVLTYTAVQSQDCAKGWQSSVDQVGAKHAGLKIVFKDTSLQFSFTPGELAADLDQMKSNGVQLLVTCIDGGGSARVGQAFKDNGLPIVQTLPNGYDSKLIAENAAVLEGSFVTVGFFPFEADQKPSALQRFIDAMKAKGKEPNENSLSGWINADLFVKGLQAAGKDVTRQSLIDAINTMSAYTADGIRPDPVDWKIAHTAVTRTDCVAVLKVQSGKLVPVYGQPGKPMICFDLDHVDLANPTFK
jgi:ABC-type branched-subunit amino acid transport system substrate-binding protein